MPEPPQRDESRRVIGVDAGGTKLLGGVVARDLTVHNRVHRLWRGADRAEVLDIMVEAVEEARAAAPDVEAVGFGIPSLVDYATGASVTSVHLPLDDVPFRDLMSERLALPVFVDNDTNAAVLAEQRHGAGRGANDVVMLTLGTGIGGGLVLAGEVYRGARGAAGEIGHMTVDLDGPEHADDCSNRGCLEAFVSGSAIARDGEIVARSDPGSELGKALSRGREITGALVTELAHDGDEAARGVLERAGRHLGVGIASVVNVLNPEVVIVGGGVLGAGELVLGPAREEAAARALPASFEAVRIEQAHFGEEAGMIGAAVLALNGMDEGGEPA